MKKITSYFAIMSLSLSTAYADLSTQQVERYLEVSGGQAVMETLQSQLSDALDAKIRVTGAPVNPKSINTIKEILTSDKNINLYKSDIKHLNLKTYQEVLKFYTTKVGKKSAETAKSMDMMTMEQEMANFIKSQKDNPFSNKKNLLIREITTTLKTLEMQTNIAKKIFIIMNQNLPKKMRMPQDKVEMMLTQISPLIEQQTMISINYTFKEYNEEELAEILKYSQSEAGKEEAGVVVSGTSKYVEATMSEIISAFISEAQSKHPEKFKKAS